MKHSNRKGFTIVELVIVIAVIAILAAVLIPTFSNIIKKANDSAALQEAENAMKNVLTMSDSGTLNEGTMFYMFDKDLTKVQYSFEFRGQKLVEKPLNPLFKLNATAVKQVAAHSSGVGADAMIHEAIEGAYTPQFPPALDARDVTNPDLPETILVVMPGREYTVTFVAAAVEGFDGETPTAPSSRTYYEGDQLTYDDITALATAENCDIDSIKVGVTDITAGEPYTVNGNITVTITYKKTATSSE